MILFNLLSKTTIALATAAILVSACHKHDDDSDTTNPVINIKSPVDDAFIQGNITIEVNLTDNSLHAMTMKVTKDTDGTEVYKDSPTIHDETDITVARTFTPSGLSTITPMTLVVDVEDHAGNKSSKSLKFKVQN